MVTRVSKTDIDAFQRIQVEPYVDFVVARQPDRARAEAAAGRERARRRQGRRSRSSSPRSSRPRCSRRRDRRRDARPAARHARVASRSCAARSYGAAAGFFGGLLVDTATLETLGLTSLLLTIAGYWIGRYGETTGRDRAHAPLLVGRRRDVLYAVGALVLRFMLGDPARAGACSSTRCCPAIVLNVLLTVPGLRAHAPRCCRPRRARDRSREVTLLG